jgi:hypothetical protein
MELTKDLYPSVGSVVGVASTALVNMECEMWFSPVFHAVS